jgi:Smg protein
MSAPFMKENTLDVLFYLFDNYSEADDITQNRDILHGYLSEAGFQNKRIHKAFDWLESLADDNLIYLSEPQARSVRHFSKFEKRWLSHDCQNYLLYLHNNRILTANTREFIIDKVLALRDINFDLDKLKWVVMLILMNHPDKEAEYTWMDDVAMNDNPPVYH